MARFWHAEVTSNSIFMGVDVFMVRALRHHAVHAHAGPDNHRTAKLPTLYSPRMEAMSTGVSCGCAVLAAAAAAPPRSHGAGSTSDYSLVAQAIKVSARLQARV
jgi:hypothetical protein